MLTAWPNHDKRKYRDRLRRAIEARKLTTGTGWDDDTGSGCLVGSLCRAYSHAKLSEEIGAPPQVIHLFDAIFEGLSRTSLDDGAQFGIDAVAAIKEGADLSLVWPRTALWMLTNEQLVEAASADERCANAVADVAALYREWVETGKKPEARRFVEAAWAAGAAEYDYWRNLRDELLRNLREAPIAAK